MTAKRSPVGEAVTTADALISLRLPIEEMAQVRAFAAAEGRTPTGFVRAMFRRGVADYKTKLAVLRQPSWGCQ